MSQTGEPLRVTKNYKQLKRHLAIVDDAPRVAGNAPRAEVLDDGLDGPVRVHARARQYFVRRVGVEPSAQSAN